MFSNTTPHVRRGIPVDHLRRVWQTVEDLAATPGRMRKELAFAYGLSVRQLQTDLNLICAPDGFDLPLTRASGYRFRNQSEPLRFTAIDAVVLVRALDQAFDQPWTDGPGVASAVLALMPVHLQPLVAMLVDRLAVRDPIVACLLDALACATPVFLKSGELHLDQGRFQPEVLIPLDGRWFVIARPMASGMFDTRSLLIALDEIDEISELTPARALARPA